MRTTETKYDVKALHHITCMASMPQPNADFYSGVLGLRLIKRTVHFDNADVYHLYYGDGAGTPGSLLTFFPIPKWIPGKHGTGAATGISFAVAPESMAYWADRLGEHTDGIVAWDETGTEPVLRFTDHDGQELGLIATPSAGQRPGWDGYDVPGEHSIRGLQAVTLNVRDAEATLTVLTGLLGLKVGEQAGPRTRLGFGDDEFGMFVDVIEDTTGPEANPVPLMGVLPEAGTVNHVAFGPIDRSTQDELRTRLIDAGFEVTDVMDRNYFSSIYFLEPCGVRLEIATGEPGFTVDEAAAEHLGESLKLPAWLENRRREYDEQLPELHGYVAKAATS